MSWRKYETHKEETKAVKAALKAAGINAKVGHGTGTAYTWLEINVGSSCHSPHDPRDPRCPYCLKRRVEIEGKALHIAREATGRDGDYDGEILVKAQDGWKIDHSYVIDQAMDIEERKAHPELCTQNT